MKHLLDKLPSILFIPLPCLFFSNLAASAVSLKASSQYEVVSLEGETFLIDELFSDLDVFGESLQPLPNSNSAIATNQIKIQFYSVADFQDLFDSLNPKQQSVINPSFLLQTNGLVKARSELNNYGYNGLINVSAFANNLESSLNTSQEKELFSYIIGTVENRTASNLQIQIGTPEEDESLLGYIGEALTNLELSAGNGSPSNLQVEVLPQVAYRDIFQGLYDFEIAPRTNLPNASGSSVPDNLLITQEYVRDYILGTNDNNFNISLVPRGYDFGVENFVGKPLSNYSSFGPSSLLDPSDFLAESPGSLTARIQEMREGTFGTSDYSALGGEISRQAEYEKIINTSAKFQSLKDPMLVEMEDQAAEIKRQMEEKRTKLQERIDKEQEQRLKKRLKQQVISREQNNRRVERQRRRQNQDLAKQKRFLPTP